MRSDPRRLWLLQEQAHIKIPGRKETREALKTIYGPRYRKVSNALFGYFSARPTANDTRPDFKIRAIAQDSHNLAVSTGKLENAGHAAGWAALQMYLNKRTIFMDQLYASDDNIVGGAALLGRLAGRLTPSSTASVEMWQCRPEFNTAIRVKKNESKRPLNDMLETLHTEYRALEPQWDHDAAIGGLVGARSLAEFGDAWDQAWAQDDAAMAARELLASDIFISEPAN